MVDWVNLASGHHIPHTTRKEYAVSHEGSPSQSERGPHKFKAKLKGGDASEHDLPTSPGAHKLSAAEKSGRDNFEEHRGGLWYPFLDFLSNEDPHRGALDMKSTMPHLTLHLVLLCRFSVQFIFGVRGVDASGRRLVRERMSLTSFSSFRIPQAKDYFFLTNIHRRVA